MARDKYVFKDSSRIYKQACDLALVLRSSINGATEWFSEAVQELESRGLNSLHDDNQWLQAIDFARQRVNSIASSIDPRIAIPALLQAVDDFYYHDKNWKHEVPICGSAMKTSIAEIWPNRNVQTAVNRSAAQLVKLVSAVMAWEQLTGSYEHYKVFGFGPVTFQSKGFEYSSDRDREVLDHWNAMALPYGTNQRTLAQSKAVILESPKEFCDAVSLVLKGQKPSSIKLFAGTVFALAGNNPDFWSGLNARLALLSCAARFKLAGSQDHGGVVLFEEFIAASAGFGLGAESAQMSIKACFWQQDWYRDRMKGYPSNMLVERPALRIDNKTFATSISTIVDSINCFVEHSVFRYMGYGGAPVDEEAFRVHVSLPFETDAVEVFQEAGWKASGVSHAGYWAANNCQLMHPDGSKVPGEIDVLALHPSGLLALVVECKVLSQPFSMSKLTNVVGKLGEADQDGFHANLEKKVNWLAAVPALRGAQVEGALLVDQGSFLGEGAKHPVVDLEHLRVLLGDLNEQVAMAVAEKS
ncbi:MULTISPECIES: hypothetical protein [Pseudomonas fluorescens group]|uniref:hypothetical protein n=1 Tax=Pseudomonas fluorescens group TaxID=136843 RepID=UPI00087A353D|nr:MULTISPECIES: hypothetical protein [Pseudomonas fluorescens group]SDU40554.1 hypothetical protein SAMN04490196_1959 [Pseudomonas moraviensis]